MPVTGYNSSEMRANSLRSPHSGTKKEENDSMRAKLLAMCVFLVLGCGASPQDDVVTRSSMLLLQPNTVVYLRTHTETQFVPNYPSHEYVNFTDRLIWQTNAYNEPVFNFSAYTGGQVSCTIPMEWRYGPPSSNWCGGNSVYTSLFAGCGEQWYLASKASLAATTCTFRGRDGVDRRWGPNSCILEVYNSNPSRTNDRGVFLFRGGQACNGGGAWFFDFAAPLTAT